jgi:adenylate cyclase
MFLGHAKSGFASVETALRLSPRDPQVPWWQFYVCAFHANLAHWEKAIEWCRKSVAGLPQVFCPLVDLAAANAWAGHDKEAKDAAAQLQKVYPGFTVQTWAGIHWSDDPTFNAQYQASSKACARRACRRARRKRTDPPVRAVRPSNQREEQQ